jgi:ribosomal-protein-alanine N-acetyltransferase
VFLGHRSILPACGCATAPGSTGRSTGRPWPTSAGRTATSLPAPPARSSAASSRLESDERLLLRPWRPTDADAVRGAFDQPDIQRWHLLRIDSDEEARNWLANWPRRWAAGTDASWAVVRTGADDRVVGQVGLRHIDRFDARAETSYWVVPDARGDGVAVRATRVLTRWAFSTLRLHRIVVQHSTANLASCRVALAAGFGAEGNQRGSMRHADGWHDSHVHGRLRETDR